MTLHDFLHEIVKVHIGLWFYRKTSQPDLRHIQQCFHELRKSIDLALGHLQVGFQFLLLDALRKIPALHDPMNHLALKTKWRQRSFNSCPAIEINSSRSCSSLCTSSREARASSTDFSNSCLLKLTSWASSSKSCWELCNSLLKMSRVLFALITFWTRAFTSSLRNGFVTKS